MIMTIDNFLSDHQCAFWHNYCKYAVENDTIEVGLKVNNKDMIRVNRKYYTIYQKFHWMDEVLRIARKNFGDDLHFQKKWYAQIMHYCNPGQGLDWHAEGRISTVSVSINITPKEEYKGANFQVKGQDIETPYKGAIFYKSDTMHRVTPLVEGDKKSLVIWLPCKEQM